MSTDQSPAWWFAGLVPRENKCVCVERTIQARRNRGLNCCVNSCIHLRGRNEFAPLSPNFRSGSAAVLAVRVCGGRFLLQEGRTDTSYGEVTSWQFTRRFRLSLPLPIIVSSLKKQIFKQRDCFLKSTILQRFTYSLTL